MPNLFESAERFYKRISGGSKSQKLSGNAGGSGGSSKYSRKSENRSDNSNPVTSANASPLRWTSQKNYSARTHSSSNLITSSTGDLADGASGGNPVSQDSPRAHPPGDLTAVSSESDSDSVQEPGSPLPIHGRAQRLRQSLQRAKAAQFETTTDNQNRYPSAERLGAHPDEISEEDDEEEDAEEEDDEEEEEDATNGEKGGIQEMSDGDEELLDSLNRSYVNSLTLQSRVGVQWPAQPPQPLVDLLPKIRRCLGPQTTEFVRAICQRPSCRCLLRGHDTLMLFPIFDVVMCGATWEKIKDSHAPSRTGSHLLSRLQHNRTPSAASETQAKLIMFRQCRGWYEVMNENYDPVPHWTTIDEVRRAKPTNFLVRRELKCLLALSSLWIPAGPPSNAHEGGATTVAAPPVPVSSTIILEARDPNAIARSSSYVLKPGTLLSYVDCIHGCTVVRGKKLKQLSLILAVEKPRPQKSNDAPTSPRRLFYIGTEDASTHAIFPPKVAFSPIAGPDNISGVHTLSSLLRKFRLPLSVVPVAVPECRPPGGAEGSNLSSLSGVSDSVDYATAQSSKPLNIFPAVPGITFTDKTFIRLRELQRGDILIMAPIDAPDRFFLITPTLLQDHLFQLGFTEDAMYHRLAAGHHSRTLRFLTMAHPRDSLGYLLNYLKNITNKPRLMTSASNDSSISGDITSRVTAGLMEHHEITSTMAKSIFCETGKDPRTGPECELTPDEVDQSYDDMDDLYFFTRNGYFPAKSRQRRSKVSVGNNIAGSRAVTVPSSSVPPPGNTRSQIPSAEQLLAQALHISTYK